ncbi:MAG: hypothetical protein ACLVAH_04560 [Anaeromassilibacillus sp.]
MKTLAQNDIPGRWYPVEFYEKMDFAYLTRVPYSVQLWGTL